MRVAIIGIGYYGYKPAVFDMSFEEMMFEASMRAHDDADIDPRKDVDVFLSCQEDFWEGISIADEFAPEPMGGSMRPVMTITGDGIQCVGQAYMIIKSGLASVVAVEAHAKPSDIVSLQEIYELALDPQQRTIGIKNPHFYAGLDAVAFMKRSGAKREHLAMVAVKNRKRGLMNGRASYGLKIDLDDVLEAPYYMYPMSSYEVAEFQDVAISLVVASEAVAKRARKPVWIDGIWWSTETGSGAYEWHEWGRAPSVRIAAREAYRQARIESPANQTDFAEVEDRFSYLELLFAEELGVAPEGSHRLLEAGDFHPSGSYPINPSGGSLSLGISLEATGLTRMVEAALQLRGEAGAVQLSDVRRAVVASWRGPPTFTSFVAVLSGE